MQRLVIFLGIVLGLAAGMLSAGCDVEAILRESAQTTGSSPTCRRLRSKWTQNAPFR